MHFVVLISVLVACVAGVPFHSAKSTQDGRIVGGTATTIENYPHQIALLYFGSLRCGGSIISPTCIVTAGHCADGVSSNYLTVRTCSTYHDNGGTVYNVTGILVHGSYDPFLLDYDVAVLKVDPPITYSNCAQSIALGDSEVPDGSSVVVTGWGRTSTGGPISPNLLEVTTEIIGDAICNATYPGEVTDRMICASTSTGGKGPCNGDSGGPLVTATSPPRLVGIVSWGPVDCGLVGYPAVYTKVSALWDWILNACNLQKMPKEITKVRAMP